MTNAQAATVARYHNFRYLAEPAVQPDGTVQLTYAASDNAGLPVSCTVVIQPDGESRATMRRGWDDSPFCEAPEGDCPRCGADWPEYCTDPACPQP